MNVAKNFSRQGKTIPAPHASKRSFVATVLVVLFGISGDIAVARAQAPDDDVPGAQVLTRGPVHEAFAGMVTFNPEPGVVVTKAPPNAIEEMPPEERPAGDNVAWIPGYWGWDDERTDFIWISGTWRALPPGREWMAGYWGQTPQGHQWISGYWADASVRETTYLPPPPATVEAGPNIAAPSVDYGWSPGCWVWYSGRYAWRPGYWVQGRADWDWSPAHYVWTPRGYIFVGGYWDYPVERRGILFAPIYFESSVYARHGYYYSPRIVIGLGVFSDHLFLRPSYSHYYFGDYYASSYVQGGFYASFSFQSSRYGYDPIYSHQHWEHRQDREWEHRVETSYQNRRDHETARPPRTWAAQRSINPDRAGSAQDRVVLAAPIEQLAKSKDGPMRFQPVAKEERQKLAQRGQEVQQSREQRRTLEAKAASPTPQKSGETFAPAKVKAPRSPIVAKAAGQFEKNQAPPQAQQAPKPDLKRQPKSEPADRPQNANGSKPQPESRQPESVRKSVPAREAVTPREQPAQPKAERPEQLEKSTPGESPQRDRKLEQPVLPPERRDKEATVTPPEDSQRKAREESQQKTRQAEQQAQTESARQTRDAAKATAATPPPDIRGLEKKTPPQSEPRAKDAAVTPRKESPRDGLQEQGQREIESPAKRRAAPSEKGGTRLLENKPRKQGGR